MPRLWLTSPVHSPGREARRVVSRRDPVSLPGPLSATLQLLAWQLPGAWGGAGRAPLGQGVSPAGSRFLPVSLPASLLPWTFLPLTLMYISKGEDRCQE